MTKIRCTDIIKTRVVTFQCDRDADTFYRDLTILIADGVNPLEARCIMHMPMALIATGKLEFLTKEEYLVAQIMES